MLVLVGTYCRENNWYGDRHRVILSPSEGVGFRTMTEAKKYAARLKKYMKTAHNIDTKMIDISCGQLDDYPSYTYNSFGPSLSYKHHTLSTVKLVEHLEAEKAEAY